MKDYSLLNQHEINAEFLEACKNGHLVIVKYLTTSPELTVHANIDCNFSEGFRWACHYGHLEVVMYLLTSPEIVEAGYQHADIHAENELGLLWACTTGNLEIVKYLLT